MTGGKIYFVSSGYERGRKGGRKGRQEGREGGKGDRKEGRKGG